ncbi:aminotransferase class V-fold PLP-dependent enzyme [Paenibacillus barengoltzii]|jgi:cysteine desulfurase family protein|uniref:aminotransferase class V-fold PLP-dependent enzyme n=1 Tax=Paenibacillus barengoltzii TaxID=343517 RepID=UPI002DB8C121|nr:aminotransferase class V-fold PLP-dependent enzyme [Paenibacillus barengoltzii]MEC2344393.1 aminotransferase class V-fold PLP-dependent enzyme [Paenibacillus barengoltzii]
MCLREGKSIIYLDHAATSWPKPPRVGEVMLEILNGPAANAGRGNHGMALQAGRVLYKTRVKLAQLFGVSNPNDIVLTSSTTSALNLAIKGWLKPGDHVVATTVEHNSVRRPLEFLKRTAGIEVDYAEVDAYGRLDLEQVEKLFRPHTRLLVCSHSSNLLGCILPVQALSQIAHAHGAILLVDAAQTAGCYPVNVQEMGIDLLAFPGHKGLLGPQGTGGLYIRSDLDLEPLMHGGTGSQSEELEQPSVRPDRYEAGTVNTPGIAGLGAGVETVLERGVEQIHRHEWKLTQFLMKELYEVPGVRLIGPEIGQPRTGIVSFTIEGRDASEVAFVLDREYGIAVRAGYHCTPLGHQTAGTLEGGAVRASVGYLTTEADLQKLVDAIHKLMN